MVAWAVDYIVLPDLAQPRITTPTLADRGRSRIVHSDSLLRNIQVTTVHALIFSLEELLHCLIDVKTRRDQGIGAKSLFRLEYWQQSIFRRSGEPVTQQVPCVRSEHTSDFLDLPASVRFQKYMRPPADDGSVPLLFNLRLHIPYNLM